MALVTAMIIPLVQVGYNLTVKLILPKYIESISLFFILSNMLYLTSMATVPNIILNSVVVNKQVFVTSINAIGTGINIILDLFIIYVGYGIEAIALVTVVSQGVATFVLYFIARKYIIKQRDKFTLFLRQIILPFIISVIFSVFHGFFYSSTILSSWFLSIISIFFQIIIWTFVILFFYGDYITKDKIVGIVKELYELASIGIKRKNRALI